ncbi:hypothetical protein [Minwuia sp.]|uniref:hypothetical protein n=1 Tax=Minwuia sp. TaxID=2493630 RepID=UPI003A95B2C7
MDQMTPLTPEEARRRKGRNIAVAVALISFVVIVFAGSVAKMSEGNIPVLNNTIGN